MIPIIFFVLFLNLEDRRPLMTSYCCDTIARFTGCGLWLQSAHSRIFDNSNNYLGTQP